MSAKEIAKHVEAIEGILEDAVRNAAESEELRNKKEQLRTVKRSIAQLTRKGIPVPKEMQNLKLSLITEMEQAQAPANGRR